MNRRVLLTALALFAALCPAQTWTQLGPAPLANGNTGRVSALVCHPTLPDRYYAGAADGGVWRTDDGGASWTPLTDAMPSSAIGAIALDPTNPQAIYVGTGEANFANHSRYGLGIYKSADGGDTWTHLAEPVFAGRCISRIIVHPTTPARLYAAVTRAGGFPELAAAKNHPGAPGPLGVFRSDDAGVTWTLLPGLPDRSITDLVIDPANPSVLYAAAGRIFGDPANAVYKTTNAGDTWTRLEGGFPTVNVGRIALAIAPTNPNRLYALVATAADPAGNGSPTLAALRSDNAGTTWTQVPTGSIQASYGWYLCVASVRPTDPNTVLFGGLNLVRSVNSGANFTTITPPHVDLHALAWDAAGRLLAGDDGGVHRSTNLGSTWESRNGGLGIIQFYAGLSTHPTDAARMIGGTQDNGTNRRTADSLMWGSVAGGDGGWTQWDQSNAQRVFAESQGTGVLYRSTNGGASFNGSGSGIDGADRNCFLPPYLIDPTDSNRMLYATHRVYRSLNGGTSWAPFSADHTGGTGAIRALAMSPLDPQTIYAATNNGRVLCSTDGGATFTLRLTDAAGWPRVTRELWAEGQDAATAYLAGATFGAPHVRRTPDRAQTWATLDGDLPDLPVNVVVTDSRCTPPVLYAGTDAGVYRSFDDGRTWRVFGQGLPRACVIDLRPEPARGRIIAATQGRGAWSAPLDTTGCTPPSDPDFNCDGNPDQDDVGCIINVVAGNPGCECQDADFNRDGNTDQDDVAALINAVAGGGCP